MKDILQQITENISTERAKWLDSVIKKAIPKWKLKILLRYNHWIVRKWLGINLEIITEELIADFGTRYVVKLNGKLIAERKFIFSYKDFS